MIAAGLPRYGEIPSVPASAEPATTVEVDVLGIVVLSEFAVAATRLPSPEEVAGPGGRAEALMRKQLGHRDGLDRGVLNRITLPELWRKIPVLRLINFVGPPGSLSNAERAAALENRKP
jgi:hypothetical protein